MPHLFSYGTLRTPEVQQATFGRQLAGHEDQLVGFRLSSFTVKDPAFVETSGAADHAMALSTGQSDDRVSGIVFEVTHEELVQVDQYEPAGYVRIQTELASGLTAWVYTSSDA